MTNDSDKVLMMWRRKNNELTTELARQNQLYSDLQAKLETITTQANKVTSVEEENEKLKAQVTDLEKEKQQWVSLQKQVDEQRELLELKEDVIKDLNKLHNQKLIQYDTLRKRFKEINNPQKYIDAFVTAQDKALDSFRGFVDGLVEPQVKAPTKKRKIDEIINTAVNGFLKDLNEETKSKDTDYEIMDQDTDKDESDDDNCDKAEKHDDDKAETHEDDKAETHDDDKAEKHDDDKVEKHDDDKAEKHDDDKVETHEDDKVETHDDDKAEKHELEDQKSADEEGEIAEQNNEDVDISSVPNRPVVFVHNKKRMIRIQPTTLQSKIGYVNFQNL